MNDPHNPAERLRRSWDTNARAWAQTVQRERIESRTVATNAAILQAVLEHSPQRVLDVGCGEGWLTRALSPHARSVVGIDASETLIGIAREQGQGSFHQLSYQALSQAPNQVGHAFDALICNFSLLDEEVTPLLAALSTLTAVAGRLYLQSVHPWSARGDAPYQDGWRTETFASFEQDFAEPMPWFYRTLGSWVQVLREGQWQLEQVREPIHPATGVPLSLLLIACPSR